MNTKLEALFGSVQKPARYTGGELGSVVKEKSDVDIRFGFCFPDLYEVGMSHLGMKLLYGLYNSMDGVWCERVFLPDEDMAALMRAGGVRLYGLESRDCLDEFDFLGFTLQYELSFTAVLHMLDLAGLPLRAAERGDDMPLVIAGGPCVCNPEPVADFFDIFVVGEGEEVSADLFELYRRHKSSGFGKKKFLREAAQIEGIYVPSLYNIDYNADGTILSVTPADGAPMPVHKRIIRDMDTAYYPDRFVVPFIDIVHDRAMSEIFRGCIRGCRFCQAGFLYRPVREKSPEVISAQSRALCENTGYEEFSLASLSTGDYTRLDELLPMLLDWAEPQKTNISLPSLRVDNFSEELAARLNVLRRSGLTFAPEAGTQRLRDSINKNLSEDEILSTARKAFAAGWTTVKLYFMMGLPTETDEDIEGIAALGQKIVDCYYQNPDRPKGKGVTVSISVSCFVPKPFTPFQWEPQDITARLEEKQRLLRNSLTTRKISLHWHDARTSVLEGVLARGDRRLCDVIEQVYRRGKGRDAWSEHMSFDNWNTAISDNGLDGEFYASRRRVESEILPWEHLDYGVNRDFLWRENTRAYDCKTTPHCRNACSKCGADSLANEGGVCVGR